MSSVIQELALARQQVRELERKMEEQMVVIVAVTPTWFPDGARGLQDMDVEVYGPYLNRGEGNKIARRMMKGNPPGSKTKYRVRSIKTVKI
jgi:hypothetical protein